MATPEKIQSSHLRAPIVVVLGHVDHGKTTLLDAIRKTNVVGKEAGGITQSIGASVITLKDGNKITFIDTPGHAAFANMRSQGAKVADLAVLVVAADDGLKPQTKEALEYIFASKIPFVVAATKTDLQTADINKMKGQLEAEGVLFESKGGDIPLISVSGKTGAGIDELLEMISLVAELHKVAGSGQNELDASVIETGKDNRGPFAAIVVRDGRLTVGDEIVSGDTKAKVRGIFNHLGKSVHEIGPGEPAQILGFSQVPAVGERIWHVGSTGFALPQVKSTISIKKSASEDELPVVIKAKNAGTLDAVLKNLPHKVFVVHSGVGDIVESDVFVAKSADADIYAFESTAAKSVAALADTESVKIKTYRIIYELLEELAKIIKEGEEVILGRAKIITSFPFNSKKVAGCKVLDGKIGKTDNLKLTRDDKEYGQVRIISMRKEKVEIGEVKQGEEFGAIFAPQLEFEEGDVLISVRK